MLQEEELRKPGQEIQTVAKQTCMKKIFEKINFRQPKYMLPAILYIPLLGASYFIFDLFHTETADIPDKTLQTTEFLNPELPEAQIKDDGIGSKYENMEKIVGQDTGLLGGRQHRKRRT